MKGVRMKINVTYQLDMTDEAKASIKDMNSVAFSIPDFPGVFFPVTGEFVQFPCDGDFKRFRVISRDFIYSNSTQLVVQVVLGLPS
jgi:hypothetical protein